MTKPMLRDVTMGQMANPSPPNAASKMGTSLCPGCFPSHPAPCLWIGESNREWPKAMGPFTHKGDIEEAPGSCL